MAAAPARPASTVVLIRSGSPHESRRTPELEVFLVRRHDNVAFMGGAHVFPGGRLDESDHIDDSVRLCDGIDAATRRMRDLSPEAAIAHHVAAIRELFEEAGILLARRSRLPQAQSKGEMIAVDADASPRFVAYRQQLTAGKISLLDIASREDVRLALDELAYFAHWVTPEVETRRFDTRFFAAVAPADQDAAHDDGETTHGEWIRPGDAIARCLAGEIALPPPTWTTLRQLEACGTVADAMAWARTRTVVRVQPEVVDQGDSRIIILPGEATRPRSEQAAEKKFLLERGRWRPMRESPDI